MFNLVHPGQVKLCDFGISGQLVDSLAKTIDAGCKPYMAPERIDPAKNKQGYDVKSDVWSLGITMIEVATGQFPYDTWRNPFQQLKQVYLLSWCVVCVVNTLLNLEVGKNEDSENLMCYF